MIVPIIIVTAIVLLVGGAIWTSVVMERKRKEKIAEVAESLGLTFSAGDDSNMRDRLGRMSLFQTGHSKKSWNCMSGDSGDVRISIFDYTYSTGSGKNKSTRNMTLVAMESSNLKIPSFSMRPEIFLDRIGGMLGLQDIDFDDDPEFSNAFVLKGEKEAAIRKMFHRELRKAFVSRKGIIIEAARGQMVCYRGHSRCKPDDYPNLLKEAYEIYGLIVDHNLGDGTDKSAGQES